MNLQTLSQLLYQIKLVDQQITQTFESQVGVSLTRYALLMFLKNHHPCRQHQLKAALKIDNAAITRHLKTLELNGYVIRQRNPDNNRELWVTLTDQAVAELNHCEHQYQANQADQPVHLSDSEMTTLLTLLNQLNLQLNQSPNGGN